MIKFRLCNNFAKNINRRVPKMFYQLGWLEYKLWDIIRVLKKILNSFWVSNVANNHTPKIKKRR